MVIDLNCRRARCAWLVNCVRREPSARSNSASATRSISRPEPRRINPPDRTERPGGIDLASFGYVMEVGKIVLSGPAIMLAEIRVS